MSKKPTKGQPPLERKKITKTIERMFVRFENWNRDLELSEHCACFFWNNIGAIAILEKLEDLNTRNKEIGIELNLYDEYADLVQNISLDFNTTLINSLKNYSSPYNYLGQLLVYADGLEPRFVLNLSQRFNGSPLNLEEIILYYDNRTIETIDENQVPPLKEYQALYRRLLCDSAGEPRKVLFDPVVQILEEDYENFPVETDDKTKEHYIKELGIKPDYVDGEIIKKLWTKNIAAEADQDKFVELPSIMLKSGHCPVSKPQKSDTFKAR